jgi:hypothetical protein
MLSPNTNTPKDIAFDTYFIGCPESGFHTRATRSKDSVLVGANLIAETSHDLFNAPLVSGKGVVIGNPTKKTTKIFMSRFLLSIFSVRCKYSC